VQRAAKKDGDRESVDYCLGQELSTAAESSQAIARDRPGRAHTPTPALGLNWETYAKRMRLLSSAYGLRADT